jgi:hypothetical protein
MVTIIKFIIVNLKKQLSNKLLITSFKTFKIPVFVKQAP